MPNSITKVILSVIPEQTQITLQAVLLPVFASNYPLVN